MSFQTWSKVTLPLYNLVFCWHLAPQGSTPFFPANQCKLIGWMSLSIKIEIELTSCMGERMCAVISRSKNSSKEQEKYMGFICIYFKRRSVCFNQKVSNICFTSGSIAEMMLGQLHYSLWNNLLIVSHVFLHIPCSFCVCTHCTVKQNFPPYDIIQNLLQCEVVKWHCKRCR